jgi:hypothetical protein
VWGPFNDENLDETLTITPSAVTGTGITLTASAALFNTEHVGAYWKLSVPVASEYERWEVDVSVTSGDKRYYEGNVYQAGTTANTGTNPPVHLNGTYSDGKVDWTYLHSGSGYVVITAFTSDTIVTADVIERLPEAAATDLWNEGSWSKYQGYPVTVAFYESRLFWGGTTRQPQTIWGSKTDQYNNYETGSKDDDALRYVLATDKVNAIEWLSPQKVMAIGTNGGEFTMSGNSTNDALTPGNVRIVRQTTYGSASERPLLIGSNTLFVQRGGKKVRDYRYYYDNDAYQADDLSILSDGISLAGLSELAYQQSPYQIVWAVRGDGKLVGLTYSQEQNVQAWHLHDVGGTVESLTVIPDDASNEDQLWLLVKRNIDGNDVRYVEVLTSDQNVRTGGDTVLNGYLDSQLTYSGAAISTVSGLDHLEGETVGVLVEGAEHPDVTVTSGHCRSAGRRRGAS